METDPFHGLRLRLLNTGITSAGLRTGEAGRLVRADGSEIVGLHAIGETASRLVTGLGYNRGYSLSRAMARAWDAGNRCWGLRSTANPLLSHTRAVRRCRQASRGNSSELVGER